jgi:hypothetical protein
MSEVGIQDAARKADLFLLCKQQQEIKTCLVGIQDAALADPFASQQNSVKTTHWVLSYP